MNEIRERRVLLETQLSQLGEARSRAADCDGRRLGHRPDEPCSCGSPRARCGCCRRSTRWIATSAASRRPTSLFAILQSLNEMPGRKTLIFFSEGLPASPALQAHLRSVVEAANRSNITVYAIDASRAARRQRHRRHPHARSRRPARSGVRQLGSIGDYTEQPMIRGDREGRGSACGSTRRAASPSWPRTPAASWSATPTTCARPSERIDEDQRFHYLLTYSPKNQRFDGNFRNITRQGRAAGRAGVRAQGLPRAALRADLPGARLRGAGAGGARRGAPARTASRSRPRR